MGVIKVDFSLNFVWIQATRLNLPETLDEVVCPVPTELMINVEDIAAQNPDVPVSLWVDIYGIGGHPERVIGAMHESVKEPNVTIKPLDSIPAYTTNPLFEKESISYGNPFDPIWQQVDLARLYVIRHCLITEGRDAAIYSDMDRNLNARPLLSANPFKAALKILSDKGIVIGRDKAMTNPENQFIGVAQSQMSFLTDVLMPKTARSIEEGKNGWEGHVFACDRFPSRDIYQPIPTLDPDKRIKKEYIEAREQSTTHSNLELIPIPT